MAATVTETHTLPVSGTPTIAVRNSAGTMTVVRGSAEEVRLVVTKKARGLFGGGSEADLERVPVTVTQEGDTIRVDAWFRGMGSFAKGITVDLDFTIPATANLDLHAAAGNVRVEGVGGSVRAEVNAGNTELRDVSGPLRIEGNAGNIQARGLSLKERCELKVNAGNIDLQGEMAAGTTLDARVNTGNITLRLPRSTAVQLEASTQVGNVAVHGWPVAVSRKLVQQSASGQTQPGASDRISARVDAGNVTIYAE
jgi:DUF4097 and DUF4098 domain-containing protein YvlB